MKDFSRYEIAEVIAEEFDLINSDIQPGDSFFDDYGADDLDMVDLCIKLETTFDVTFEPCTEQLWLTVQDVYDQMEAFPKAVTADA